MPHALPIAPRATRSVVVVASHDAVRAGLTALLGSTPDLTVVAGARDAADARRCLPAHHPDVLVLSLPRALSDGGALVRELRAIGDEVPVVVVGADPGDAYISVAREAGATAYVTLDDPAETVAWAVAAAAR